MRRPSLAAAAETRTALCNHPALVVCQKLDFQKLGTSAHSTFSEPLNRMTPIPGLPKACHVYRTSRGLQVCGDSRDVLNQLAPESVDLIVTSPPFALLRQKSYGNAEQSDYVSWLCEFGQAAFPTLKATGSFVMDLGGSYQKGKPVRSLCGFRVLLEFCDRIGYRLAEDFYWFNPAKLPSPIEWVNKRKMRAKDAVNTVWWFSKGDWPKADVAGPDALFRPHEAASPRSRVVLQAGEAAVRPRHIERLRQEWQSGSDPLESVADLQYR